MDKKFSCGRCQDTGEVLISYAPTYETCPLCDGTTIPQKLKKDRKP